MNTEKCRKSYFCLKMARTITWTYKIKKAFYNKWYQRTNSYHLIKDIINWVHLTPIKMTQQNKYKIKLFIIRRNMVWFNKLLAINRIWNKPILRVFLQYQILYLMILMMSMINLFRKPGKMKTIILWTINMRNITLRQLIIIKQQLLLKNSRPFKYHKLNNKVIKSSLSHFLMNLNQV